MKDLKAELMTLVAELDNGLTAYCKLSSFLEVYLEKMPLRHFERTMEQAIVISDLLVNTYTCLETLFLRISQYFENNLPNDRWHSALLDKMTLEIPEYRPRVLSADSRNSLKEILKFRHFKRYYFSLEYSWDKLDYLILEFRKIRHEQALEREIKSFISYIKELQQ